MRVLLLKPTASRDKFMYFYQLCTGLPKTVTTERPVCWETSLHHPPYPWGKENRRGDLCRCAAKGSLQTPVHHIIRG